MVRGLKIVKYGKDVSGRWCRDCDDINSLS